MFPFCESSLAGEYLFFCLLASVTGVFRFSLRVRFISFRVTVYFCVYVCVCVCVCITSAIFVSSTSGIVF